MLPDRMTKLLTAYVDGELTSRQRRSVLRLLQRSPEARRLFKRLKGDSMILQALPRRKLQMDLSGSVLLTINARSIQLRPEACPPLPPRSTKRPWKKWLAIAGVAAAVLIAIGTVSYFFFGNLNNNDTKLVETPSTQGKRSPSPRNPDDSQSMLPESPISVVHDVDPMQTTPTSTTPKRPQQELAGILTPKPQAYQVAVPRLVRLIQLRNLDQPIASQQLQQELQSANTFRLDLFSNDPATMVERLQAGLKGRGTNLRLDSATQANLGRKARMNYAVYSEEMTAEDLFQVLNQLGAEDRKKPILQQQVLNALAAADVARALGGEPVLYPPPPERQGPLGVDITKPISEGTGSQLVKSLSRPEGTPSTDRQALALTYSPPNGDRFPPLSKEIKSFVDARRSTYREGAVQVLFVIWNQ